MKQEEIEDLNYVGEEANYVGEEVNYTGENDDIVHFSGGAKSFIDESKSDLRFGFKIVNANNTKKVVAIAFGSFQKPAEITEYTGETVDALIADGALIDNNLQPIAGLTAEAANPKLKLYHLQRFTLRNPSSIHSITLQSNTDLAFQEKVTIIKANPFFPSETRYLDLNDFLDQYAQNSKKIDIPVKDIFPDFAMDDQAIVLLPVGGKDVIAGTGVSVAVTLKYGSVINLAAAPNKKRNKARKALERKIEIRKYLAER